jgi:hypothetical protein
VRRLKTKISSATRRLSALIEGVEEPGHHTSQEHRP